MEARGTGKRLRLWLLFTIVVASAASTASAHGKGKSSPASSDDPTYQFFQWLDNNHNGQLSDYCVVADTYSDPSQPNATLQHVLRVDYDNKRFFGRFRIYVRGVTKLTAGQLKEYTPDQLYGFGSDVAKFEKITPGPFGLTGDVYFLASGGRELAPAPITEEVKQEYDFFLTRFIRPALEKK